MLHYSSSPPLYSECWIQISGPSAADIIPNANRKRLSFVKTVIVETLFFNPDTPHIKLRDESTSSVLMRFRVHSRFGALNFGYDRVSFRFHYQYFHCVKNRLLSVT